MSTTVEFVTKDDMSNTQDLLDKQVTIPSDTPCRWVALSKEKAQEIAEEVRRQSCDLRNSAKNYIYGP